MELSRSEQSHAFSVDEENKLWEEGVLGNSSPQVLLDTMVFQCGIYFPLCSGQEHRDLTIDEIEIVEEGVRTFTIPKM